MDITIDDVINRNVMLNTLEEAKVRLMAARRNVNDMTPDTCHDIYYNNIKKEYELIIDKIGELVVFIEEDNWCYSDNNLEKVTDKW